MQKYISPLYNVVQYKRAFVVNPRRACAAKLPCLSVSLSVCLCVCLSAKSHLTPGASVRRENAATYSVGNKGQKIVAFSLKLLLYRDRALLPLDCHAYDQPFSCG